MGPLDAAFAASVRLKRTHDAIDRTSVPKGTRWEGVAKRPAPEPPAQRIVRVRQEFTDGQLVDRAFVGPGHPAWDRLTPEVQTKILASTTTR